MDNCLPWVACLRKPVSYAEIGQLIKKCEFDLEPWLSKGAIREVADRKYLASFEGWVEALPLNCPDRKQLLPDKDGWQHVLESEFVRSTFYDLIRVRQLFRFNDALIGEEGYYYPVFVPLFLSLHTKDIKQGSNIMFAFNELLASRFIKTWHSDLSMGWVSSMNYHLETERLLKAKEWEEVKLRVEMTRYAGIYANVGVKTFDKIAELTLKYSNIETRRRAIGNFLRKLGL